MPRTALIVCAKAPVYMVYVPAIRCKYLGQREWDHWRCTWCGARVKVVA